MSSLESKLAADLAIVVHPTDSVAVALVDLSPGDQLTLESNGQTFALAIYESIPFGHKIALAGIPRGGDVVKYGEVIGEASADIAPGDWVHVHNLVSKRGAGQHAAGR